MMYSFTFNQWPTTTGVPPCPPVGSPDSTGGWDMVYDAGVWYHYDFYGSQWAEMTALYEEYQVGLYSSPSDFTPDDCYVPIPESYQTHFTTLTNQTGPFTASPSYP